MYTSKPLDESPWDAFAARGGCWCMGFQLGFVRNRKIGKHRWVVKRTVELRAS